MAQITKVQQQLMIDNVWLLSAASRDEGFERGSGHLNAAQREHDKMVKLRTELLDLIHALPIED
jgi:hypothetical protein